MRTGSIRAGTVGAEPVHQRDAVVLLLVVQQEAEEEGGQVEHVSFSMYKISNTSFFFIRCVLFCQSHRCSAAGTGGLSPPQ